MGCLRVRQLLAMTMPGVGANILGSNGGLHQQGCRGCCTNKKLACVETQYANNYSQKKYRSRVCKQCNSESIRNLRPSRRSGHSLDNHSVIANTTVVLSTSVSITTTTTIQSTVLCLLELQSLHGPVTKRYVSSVLRSYCLYEPEAVTLAIPRLLAS